METNMDQTHNQRKGNLIKVTYCFIVVSGFYKLTFLSPLKSHMNEKMGYKSQGKLDYIE